MIVVCEPQCTGASHEKVNSGFIALVRQAYPTETIRFYAESTHRAGLEAILAHDGVVISNLEHRELEIRDANSIRGAYAAYRQFERMLEESVAAGATRILFLSSNPVFLHILKRLRSRPDIAALRFSFVLHADFEDIANHTFEQVQTTAVAEPSLIAKLRMIRLAELPRKAARLVQRTLHERYADLWRQRFRELDQLKWRADAKVTYIALSPHVREAGAKYLDVDAIGVRNIEMPINFAPISAAPTNSHLKIATFGYGDPAALRQVMEHLDRLRPTKPYEVRIIGMDNRGLEHHPNVVCTSPGKHLPRAEMERQAADVDAFLILYNRDRYRLSCSGAIFEAMSYVKPVLHRGNPCVAQFDPADSPIGFAEADLEGVARRIAEMIDDYPAAQAAFADRRRNILKLRDRLGMEALAPKLRAAFV